MVISGSQCHIILKQGITVALISIVEIDNKLVCEYIWEGFFTLVLGN